MEQMSATARKWMLGKIQLIFKMVQDAKPHLNHKIPDEVEVLGVLAQMRLDTGRIRVNGAM